MAENFARKLIADHLTSGRMTPGAPISLRIDQTLTQDATGTLVMLEVEAMGLESVRTELSAQYVDHNLIQEDYKNADDHQFLLETCDRLGVHFNRPGDGVSHPVHQQRFGRPGATLLGSDSHTCAAGAIGMLAIGVGGLDVAMAMAGEPFHLRMPEIWGIELVGQLPAWVSAKDVILEMLRRHGVSGGAGCILEYHGSGLEGLSVNDRHVIANMGAELGATSTVFPADERVRQYLAAQGRENAFTPIAADDGAAYDRTTRIDLSELEPLIAMPSSPENVVPVREVAGRPIHQSYIGSSANPGFRDFAVAARIVEGQRVPRHVSFDINPTSRQVLDDLGASGDFQRLIRAGARFHQAGCNGCIGMGQAPATDTISLRTVPRNFPGRSGTPEDKVCLVSPETAAASALRGVITDPRSLDMAPPEVETEESLADTTRRLSVYRGDETAAAASARSAAERGKGPNIKPLPELEPFPDELRFPVLLVAPDDVSTDEILPAGNRVLPFRSNIDKIAEFSFAGVDPEHATKARGHEGPYAVVGGWNYGQGSSREHAALAPRTLGLRVVVARSFSRIHRQNLVNFGVLPLHFIEETDSLEVGTRLEFSRIFEQLEAGEQVSVELPEAGESMRLRHDLTPRELEVLRAGGLIGWMRRKLAA